MPKYCPAPDIKTLRMAIQRERLAEHLLEQAKMRQADVLRQLAAVGCSRAMAMRLVGDMFGGIYDGPALKTLAERFKKRGQRVGTACPRRSDRVPTEGAQPFLPLRSSRGIPPPHHQKEKDAMPQRIIEETTTTTTKKYVEPPEPEEALDGVEDEDCDDDDDDGCVSPEPEQRSEPRRRRR